MRKHGYLLLPAALLLGACRAMPEAAAPGCTLVPPPEAMACTMQYDPVCGCDDVTYGNACMARGAGVPHHEPGACGGDDAL